MAPSLNDGDHVLLRRYGRFHRPRPGDVACICRNDGPMLIKRLGPRSVDGRFGLSGDGAASAPAIDLGFAADHEIVGRAILRLSGSRIRLVRRPYRWGDGLSISSRHPHTMLTEVPPPSAGRPNID